MAQKQPEAVGVDDDEPTFNPNDWIGKGKKYPEKDVPDYISEAKGATLRIPEEGSKLLPVPDLPIAIFLAKELPSQSSELVSSTPDAWFSKDPPFTDVSILFNCPVPPDHLILRLEQHYGQAWFDGCQSIADPRFNQRSERFPVWVLRWWKMVAKLGEGQATWKRSLDWLLFLQSQRLWTYEVNRLVVTLYSNTGGKNKRHDAKTDTSAIAGLSYIGVKVFEHRFLRLFSAIPEQTAALGTHSFEFISHYSFLVRIPGSWVSQCRDGNVELNLEAKNVWSNISANNKQLQEAMKLFTKRRQTQELEDDDGA